jgi:hypothetical protein
MKINEYFGRCTKCEGVMVGTSCPNCQHMATITFDVLEVSFVQRRCSDSVHRDGTGHNTKVSCLACSSTGFISWNLDMGRPALVSDNFIESARRAKLAFSAAA